MSEESANQISQQANENTPSDAINPQTPMPAGRSSGWGGALGAGVFGGAIAGLFASYGDGKLGLAGFVVFLFVMMGINGGGRKTLAAIVFGITAAAALALLKH